MATGAGATMRHAALLYSSPDDAARRLAPMVDASLDEGGAVLVCLDDVKKAALLDHLGPRADRVTILPSGVRYARPAHAVAALDRFITRQRDAGARRIHSVGEIELRGDDQDVDWLRYEAAVNDIFSREPLDATCLYPRTADADALASIRQTHPLLEDDGLHSSDCYVDAAAGCSHLPAVRLAPLRQPELTAQVDGPRAARAAIEHALAGRAAPEVASDAMLVASELVTNAVVHGSGRADVSIWLEKSALVLSVHDDGPGIVDPFAGLRPPSLPERGAGLWVAHHLADRVALECTPTTGTTVTARFELPAT